MNRISQRIWFGLILAIVLAVGMIAFCIHYIANAGRWATFSGSPHVYSGGNLNSGIVTDRDGTVLLDATDGRVYAESSQLRKATLHILGDRYGYIPSWVLEEYSDELIGYSLLNGTYSMDGSSGMMRLTICAEAQTVALQALNGKKGTVGVYNYKTGEILCAVSSPTYDPDHVPDIDENDSAYDGIYVNRFFGTNYVPGSIFKLMTAAAAIEQIDDIESQTFTCEGSYVVDGEIINCNGYHGQINFEQALAVSCNCAFGQIAQQLGARTMQQYAQELGITESLEFDGIDTVSGHFDVVNVSEAELAWSGIGQHTNLVNPCQYMTFMGAIANGGKTAQPYLVERAGSGGLGDYRADTTMRSAVLDSSTCSKLTEMMRNNVVSVYGTGKFPDLYVCGKSGTAEVGAGLSPHATFAGFVQDAEYPLAFIVVVENGGSGSDVAAPIAGQVLSACIAALD